MLDFRDDKCKYQYINDHPDELLDCCEKEQSDVSLMGLIERVVGTVARGDSVIIIILRDYGIIISY